MRTRLVLSVALFSLILCDRPATAAFDGPTLRCRMSVVKSASKMLARTLKATSACAKERASDGDFSDLDCTDLDQVDLDAKIADAEETFAEKLDGPKSRCNGIVPVNALYAQCPAPCNETVPAISSRKETPGGQNPPGASIPPALRHGRSQRPLRGLQGQAVAPPTAPAA